MSVVQPQRDSEALHRNTPPPRARSSHWLQRTSQGTILGLSKQAHPRGKQVILRGAHSPGAERRCLGGV